MDAYPLPNIDKLVSKVAQYSIFSTIDMHHSYYQVPIYEDDKPLAFETAEHPYQFKKISFGVTKKIAYFQRLMNKIITDENLNGFYAYFDDITICGNIQMKYDRHLGKYLGTMKKCG